MATDLQKTLAEKIDGLCLECLGCGASCNDPHHDLARRVREMEKNLDICQEDRIDLVDRLEDVRRAVSDD